MIKEKVTKIVGRYLAPPDRAVALCVDERALIQAHDRTQPSLLLKKDRVSTLTTTEDDTALFAALDLLIGDCMPPTPLQEVPDVLASHRLGRSEVTRRPHRV